MRLSKRNKYRRYVINDNGIYMYCICPVCGKEIDFYSYNMDTYCYKELLKGKIYVFCSWNCLTAFRRVNHLDKNRKRTLKRF